MVVTGIGQCSLDYLALVDSFPEADTKNEVLQWEEQGGGPVATALVALSRLGIKCRFHGIIGDDLAGEKIRKSLIDEHVDVKGLLKRDSVSSQFAFIIIENSGKRTIFWKRPSGDELRPEELGVDFLKHCNFLLLDGLMKDSSLYAAKKAKSMNIPVMLDAGRVREGMLDIAKFCDYVVASEEFAKDLGWSENPEIFWKKLKKLRLNIVTITLGSRGSITFLKDKYFYIPAFRVETVDTTGAGDVFHGGYIFGILQGWNIMHTVRFASALAAMKCTKVGGRSGIPSLNEVLKYLEEKRTF
ncbi:MAG: sugar kinase [Nitrospirota bacterium]|nr:sugar kinase [Nitrospirota bacterium]MDH5768126.1 sugar kinase [Nitrospirota bacterium]